MHISDRMIWIVLGVIWLLGFAVACGMFKSWGDMRGNLIGAALWPLITVLLIFLLTFEIVGGFIDSRRDVWGRKG